MKAYSHLKLYIYLLSCVILLCSCGNETMEEVDENVEKQPALTSSNIKETEVPQEDRKDIRVEDSNFLKNAPKPPETLEELVNYPFGSLAESRFYNNERIYKQTITDNFPTLVENPTKSEIDSYWAAILSLVAEDYSGPDNILTEFFVEDFEFEVEVDDQRYVLKDNFNVQIILDVSKSMGEIIDGQTRLDIAKETILDFTEALPEEAQIALRVYGHSGGGEEVSCKSTELAYDFQPFNQSELKNALSKYKPTGWTPIAYTLEQAIDDFSQFSAANSTNIIYLVSDGVETCNGDPVAVAKKISENSHIKPVINVIGMDVDSETKSMLQQISAAGEGLYADATNKAELKEELETAKKLAQLWDAWKRDSIRGVQQDRIEKVGDVNKIISDWNHKTNREHSNILHVIVFLRENDFITSRHETYLMQKAEERKMMMTEFTKEMREYLYRLTDQSYDDIIHEIESSFDE